MSRFGKYGYIDRNSPEAAARCDRGGEIRKKSELRAEMQYAGDRLVPNGFWCCRFHIDTPNPQSRPAHLRPDPVPVQNARPDTDFAYLAALPRTPVLSAAGSQWINDYTGALLTVPVWASLPTTQPASMNKFWLNGGSVSISLYSTAFPTSSAGLAIGILYNDGGLVMAAGNPGMPTASAIAGTLLYNGSVLSLA